MNWYVYLTRKELMARDPQDNKLDYLKLKVRELPEGESLLDYGFFSIRVSVNKLGLTVDLKSAQGDLSSANIYLTATGDRREPVDLDLVVKKDIVAVTFAPNDGPILFIIKGDFIWWLQSFEEKPEIYEIPEV